MRVILQQDLDQLRLLLLEILGSFLILRQYRLLNILLDGYYFFLPAGKNNRGTLKV